MSIIDKYIEIYDVMMEYYNKTGDERFKHAGDCMLSALKYNNNWR